MKKKRHLTRALTFLLSLAMAMTLMVGVVFAGETENGQSNESAAVEETVVAIEDGSAADETADISDEGTAILDDDAVLTDDIADLSAEDAEDAASSEIALQDEEEDAIVFTLVDKEGKTTEVKTSDLANASAEDAVKKYGSEKNGWTEVRAKFYSLKSILANAEFDTSAIHGLAAIASDKFTTGFSSDQLDEVYLFDNSTALYNGEAATGTGWRTAVDGSEGRKWASDVVTVKVVAEGDHAMFFKKGSCKHYCAICDEPEPVNIVWTWAEDKASAEAAFLYQYCGETKDTVSATDIRVQENTEKGLYKEYTAKITYGEKEYSNTVGNFPESAHPYADNCNETWTFDGGEAVSNGLVLTFSEDTATEAGYDYITITDADGNEIGQYSGKELSGTQVYVPTASFTIGLTSDKSGNAYGFDLDSIEANGDKIDLEAFGEISKIAPVPVNGTPEYAVTLSGKTLVKDTDYTVSYDTSAAGTAELTVTGIGDYEGTLEKEFVVYKTAVKITDFDITSAEHDDADAELNQTIIATVTFDSDIKLSDAEALADQLLITIAGDDVKNTARTVTYKAEGNKLTITMVSTGWVAIYNGVMAITDTDESLTALSGTEEGAFIVWEKQSGNIPTGIAVSNKVIKEGAADAAASTKVTVTHKANMRGMYHFQLVSIAGDGTETIVKQMTSHAHDFYGSITKEAIAGAMASSINNIDGYTTTYEEDADNFTVTADNPVAGEKLAVRMFEIKNSITFEKEDLSNAKVTLANSSLAYTGKALTPAVKSVVLDGKTLTGSDYSIAYADNTKVGKATVTVTGKGDYTGSAKATFTITKANQPMKATAAKKAKSAKSKKKTVIKKAITVKQAQGKVTYKKVSVKNKKFAKKFTVNTKNGNITVAKGVKKGTYKITVKVTAAGNANYNAASKNVTVTVKVK